MPTGGERDFTQLLPLITIPPTGGGDGEAERAVGQVDLADVVGTIGGTGEADPDRVLRRLGQFELPGGLIVRPMPHPDVVKGGAFVGDVATGERGVAGDEGHLPGVWDDQLGLVARDGLGGGLLGREEGEQVGGRLGVEVFFEPLGHEALAGTAEFFEIGAEQRGGPSLGGQQRDAGLGLAGQQTAVLDPRAGERGVGEVAGVGVAVGVEDLGQQRGGRLVRHGGEVGADSVPHTRQGMTPRTRFNEERLPDLRVPLQAGQRGGVAGDEGGPVGLTWLIEQCGGPLRDLPVGRLQQRLPMHAIAFPRGDGSLGERVEQQRVPRGTTGEGGEDAGLERGTVLRPGVDERLGSGGSCLANQRLDSGGMQGRGGRLGQQLGNERTLGGRLRRQSAQQLQLGDSHRQWELVVGTARHRLRQSGGEQRLRLCGLQGLGECGIAAGRFQQGHQQRGL